MLEVELLKRCGLSESEQEVLLFLLRNGEHRAGMLTKRMDQKRGTIYTALSGLEALGLVTKKKRKGVYYFVAIAPQEVSGVLLERGKKVFHNLQRDTERLGRCLEEYDHADVVQLSGYEITSYDSPKSAATILQTMLLAGDYCGIFDPQLALEGPFASAAQSFIRASAKRQPTIREIVVPGARADEWRRSISNPNHRIKFLKKKSPLPTDILLSDGGALLTNYQKGKEMSVLIRHADYYQSMQLIFESLWSELD